MGHIDDAVTRVGGKPAPTLKPSFFKRFVSERQVGRAGADPEDTRRYPSVSAAAREAIEARRRRSLTASTPPRLAAELDPHDKIFGLRQLVHYAGFACRAVLRHKVLVVLSFALTFSMLIVATKFVPRRYEIEVTILTQRNSIMKSLTNPYRALSYDEDAPTKAAAEIVLRRDTVMALIRQTDLINEWDRTRAPILRAYDDLIATIVRRQPTREEKLDALIRQIERHMVVSAADTKDGVVTINLKWPDAHSGFLLVQAAQNAFLEARQRAETQEIAEAITVLERSGESLNKNLKVTLNELTRTQGRVLSELGPMRSAAPSSSIVARLLDSVGPVAGDEPLMEGLGDPTTLAGPRLDRLKATISRKRFELTRLELEQKGKLDSLQAQLSVARTIYTPNHPTVQSLQQNVAALQHNSPQIMILRNELDRLEIEADEHTALAAEQVLQSEMRKRGAAPRPQPRLVPVAPLAAAPPAPADRNADGLPRPTVVAELATLSLRTQLNQLRSTLERTDAARIELEVAKAAFKHRYSTVSPAEEPSSPIFPETRYVLLAGVLASILFGLFAAIAADVLSSRVLEPWQVQRQLGLPLLGTVKLS